MQVFVFVTMTPAAHDIHGDMNTYDRRHSSKVSEILIFLIISHFSVEPNSEIEYDNLQYSTCTVKLFAAATEYSL